MKLKPVKKLQRPEQQVEPAKKETKKKTENKLPPDVYHPMFPPKRLF